MSRAGGRARRHTPGQSETCHEALWTIALGGEDFLAVGVALVACARGLFHASHARGLQDHAEVE